MRIFLAGATGVVGRRLAVLLQDAGHEVAGTTRSPDKVAMLRGLGIEPVVVDMFDAAALAEAVMTARPDIVIHQVTDLPSAPGTLSYPAAQQANRRLRIEARETSFKPRRRPAPAASSRRALRSPMRPVTARASKPIRSTSPPKARAS